METSEQRCQLLLLSSNTFLIIFIFDDLMRFFSHQYVAQHSISNAKKATIDEDYITSVAIGSQDYLQDLKKRDGKWISTCAVFLKISHDLVEFINAYRIGDSITIELGYQNHSSAWEVLKRTSMLKSFLVKRKQCIRTHLFRDYRNCV